MGIAHEAKRWVADSLSHFLKLVPRREAQGVCQYHLIIQPEAEQLVLC